MPDPTNASPDQPWTLTYHRGLQYVRQQNIKPAKEAFVESLYLSIASKEVLGSAANLCELGKLCGHAAYYEKGGEYLFMAIQLCRKIRDPRGLAPCLLGLADMALRRGDVPQAEQFVQEGRHYAYCTVS